MKEQTFGLLSPDNLETALKAAYDLRSLYLHQGVQLNSLLEFDQFEVGLPYHMHFDKKSKKTLAAAPSFFALERIIRSALRSQIKLKITSEH